MSQCNQRSSNSMKRGKNLELIPTDLIMEIFSRLPSKSAARFRCLSKLWGSMLSCPYFTELFLTKSSARPRLLFAAERDGEWLFYSTPQPQNPYDKSSLVVTAEFHTKFHEQMYGGDICSYASGLVYYPNFLSTSKKNQVPMICNPITGQYVTLPELDCCRKSLSFLGFDPIDKQFKVVSEDHNKILTLGTGKLRWRKNFHCHLSNYYFCSGICINGVLYYLAEKSDDVILCFDVRSEKSKLIQSECILFFDKLINYKGNLCGIELKNKKNKKTNTWDDAIELCMWVIEDVEKQEWSKYVYTLPENKIFGYVSIAGATATGEIVLYKEFMSKAKPFYVFYFNPERNTLLSVEVQGFETRGRVYPVVDYVENLSVNDSKLLKSSIYEEEAQPKYHYEKGQNHNIGKR